LRKRVQNGTCLQIDKSKFLPYSTKLYIALVRVEIFCQFLLVASLQYSSCWKSFSAMAHTKPRALRDFMWPLLTHRTTWSTADHCV